MGAANPITQSVALGYALLPFQVGRRPIGYHPCDDTTSIRSSDISRIRKIRNP